MKSSLVITTLLLGCLTLIGCDGETPEVKRNQVSIPALPIIQDAVFELTPLFNGQRNPIVMEKICGLARGEVSQEQTNDFLKLQGIDANRIPKEDPALGLLVNGDRAGQATACAAYLATSVLSPVDASEFLKSVAPSNPQSKPTEKSENNKKVTGKDKAVAKQDKVEVDEAKPSLVVDNAQLAKVLPIKLAVARANADVFALIATELQRHDGLTIPEFREKAKKLFGRLAPVYLDRIKLQMPPAGSTYRLVRLDGDRFVFSSSSGSLFEFGGDGLTLTQNSVTWYGQGKLLGKDYQLQVAYFPESVDVLLNGSDE